MGFCGKMLYCLSARIFLLAYVGIEVTQWCASKDLIYCSSFYEIILCFRGTVWNSIPSLFAHVFTHCASRKAKHIAA